MLDLEFQSVSGGAVSSLTGMGAVPYAPGTPTIGLPPNNAPWQAGTLTSNGSGGGTLVTNGQTAGTLLSTGRTQGG